MATSNHAKNANVANGIIVGFALLFLALSSAPVMATTYKNVDCYCDPASQVDGSNQLGINYCACEQDYTLGELATKEFRFRCKNANASMYGMDVYIDGLRSATTCTISLTVTDYISKSCTNWSLTHTDTVELKTHCPFYDPQINSQITD